ncbi:putative D-xylose isomerase [Pectobacterium atrosepticum SCRI1043]|uniref:Xylose isomerase n=1 Tax=Pectobacterium atrosepticum (strain SCRI 1043 / ATCC BAA-672) TaxID=218491 RepID=XYLA_PECAS|nr:xylose isomerase [Pectobacterium atrosepticum]Q6DB05.1 RecName: Full=Xylose isomerase [Pectobacterium atrosepticum SCRI1043]GKV87402.1 xylose isomerase [Pectobacterium carotovorum subsp. carotovorum]AIA69115.1 xylose isomerase [Pectobacterium atrosepticum]AIK12020.1 xylose isomerase [Pectobacterium atrosepticum]ATY88971.1 xylose isomerase [Pectobacterium atrosepticum]KFX13567.1 xylose isomerase [Pectobacterium atrosepticum]
MQAYFEQIEKVRYEGSQSSNPFAFRHYNPDQEILGKRMADHLRFAVAYWHTFCWNGSDMFGVGSFARPWQQSGDALELAKRKADIAFEFFQKLSVPYYCFHDVDVAPEGNSLKEYLHNIAVITDVLAEKQQDSGVKLLWGTANCFTNPRYGAGAATNPDPDVFAWAATQVFTAMNATKTLGGENYVLWGGREGYETLLNTDLRQEREQIGRFMQMVVEHKHKIGFQGTLLIEPKPQEPTKHQYDYDVATVYGFLKQFGLEKEIKVNVEANHATLAGHSFHHEIATAVALGVFGSVDANRGDPQLGWDTDQFPNSVEENTLIMYEILKAGGFTTGGLNFDAKVRRQSTDRYDLFHAHIGAMDTMALALKAAARMIEDDKLNQLVAKRYAGWNGELGQQILQGNASLESLAQYAESHQLAPQHQSGQQELLENLVNRHLFG